MKVQRWSFSGQAPTMQQSPGHLVSLIALNRAAGWPWQDGRDWWPLAGSRAAAIMIPDLGRDAKGHHDCQPGRGVQMRCLECGAESAEAARVCARCGAPVARQTSAGADPAEGGSGDPIAPPAGDGLHQPAGQRPEPSNPPWVRNALVLACLGLVALVAVTALAWSVPTLIARSSSSASPRSSVSASPRSSASSVPATGHLTIYQLRAGDCLQDYSGVTFFNEGNGPFTAKPCTQPHAAEVFFAGNAWPRSQAYLGDASVDHGGNARCRTAFSAYDGIANSFSAFDNEPSYPDRRTWLGGDRWLVCFAFISEDLPVDYSIRGSGQ